MNGKDNGRRSRWPHQFIERKTAGLHATFTVAVPASSALAERLQNLPSGERSEWVRSRINGYDLATAEVKRLKRVLAEHSTRIENWAALVHERDHELGRHTGGDSPNCAACVEQRGGA